MQDDDTTTIATIRRTLPIDDLIKLAERVSETEIVPASYRGKPGSIIAAMVYGQELGFQPMQALAALFTIQGKVSIYADGLTALAYQSGLVEHLESDGARTDEGAWEGWCEIQRRGYARRRFSFTEAQAIRADLASKPMWQKYPERMYRARAVSFAVRDVFPDVVRGLMSVEEMMSGDELIFPSEPGLAPEGYAAYVDGLVALAGSDDGKKAAGTAFAEGTPEQRRWLQNDQASILRITQAHTPPPDPVSPEDLMTLGGEVFDAPPDPPVTLTAKTAKTPKNARRRHE